MGNDWSKRRILLAATVFTVADATGLGLCLCVMSLFAVES